MVAQDVLEIVAGKLVDDEEALTFALCLLLLVGQLLLLHLDAILLGQIFQRFGIGELFVLHDEVYGIASLAAGKAFAQSLGR